MRRVVIDLRSASLARLAGTDLGRALRRDEIPTVVVTALADEELAWIPWTPRDRQHVPSLRTMTPHFPAPTAGTWRASLGLALTCWSHETGRQKMRRAA